MRLVLCDDNRILCEALASILKARGHSVLAIATSTTDSIAAVGANRPDACLLDLRFPDGSGLDIARAIRRSHPDTKIVVLSCVTDPAVMSEAKKIGAVGFLRKDQKPEKLTGALEVISAGGYAPGSHAARKTGAATDRGGPEYWADGPRDEDRDEYLAQPYREHADQAWRAQPRRGRRYRQPSIRRQRLPDIERAPGPDRCKKGAEPWRSMFLSPTRNASSLTP